MTDINSLNTLTQYKAKLREDINNLDFAYDSNDLKNETIIKRADVLKLLYRS